MCEKIQCRVLIFLFFLMAIVACDKEEIAPSDSSNGGTSSTEVLLFQDIHEGPKSSYIVRMVDGTGKQLTEMLPYPELRQRAHEQALILLSDYEIAPQVAVIYARLFAGFAAKLTAAEADVLREDLRVLAVEPDQNLRLESGSMSLQATDAYTGDGQGQTIPWGVHEAGHADGTGSRVWILDTGVDMEHPDLHVDEERSLSFVAQPLAGAHPAQDQHGHGTMLAGVVGAKDNDIGIVGVASGASIVSLKVLNYLGDGMLCHLLAAIDHVAAYADDGDVALIGVGANYSGLLDYALKAEGETDIKWVIAAGNDGIDCSELSPACTEDISVYTVSAMSRMYEFAPFSNHGATVDFAAPGVYVNSTNIGGNYAFASGAGIAAAHVAGILAVGEVVAGGYVSDDPDSVADPIARLTF